VNLDVFDHEAYVLSPEEITPESVVKKLDICCGMKRLFAITLKVDYWQLESKHSKRAII